MRWSIIRLIWLRELRDQLRDRRTLFMIAVLPLLLYPVLGIGVLSISAGFARPQNRVGIHNAKALPQPGYGNAGTNPLPATAWLATVPVAPVSGADWLATSQALSSVSQTYPPLLAGKDSTLRFAPFNFDSPEDSDVLRVRELAALDNEEVQQQLASLQDSQRLSALLRQEDVDLILIVPPDFEERLESEERPTIHILAMPDERSAQATARVRRVLDHWQRHLRQARLVRRGLSLSTGEPIEVVDVARDKPAGEREGRIIVDLMGKIFPFLLVMWSLAGALYPAVDLCAGEKERGTMETLLISPASREEIVYGKFLAIWVFSAATALLNLVSMGITTWQFISRVPGHLFQPTALIWCLVLLLPLSAFFSALCLAIGAYARSTKEGQYYLMPLFLLTMPLVFLTLLPEVKLGPFYAMVPVTGVALLLRRLLENNPDTLTTGLYFIPVLGPMLIYGWLGLRWAILQFQREEVLFREAERLDLGLWLKGLLRHKQPMPTAGQAMLCFGVIFALRWFTFHWTSTLSVIEALGVSYLAFVLLPTVLSVVILNRRPLQALSARPCSWRPALMAMALAALLVLPLGELGSFVLQQFPEAEKLLREGSPIARELSQQVSGGAGIIRYLLVMGIVAPVCEELAFRGLILNGLFRSFRPWTAVLLSSFLFAVYTANVFQFLPSFVLGVLLAMFTVRTRSIVPAVLFHSVHNTLLLLIVFVQGNIAGDTQLPPVIRLLVAGLLLLIAVALLGRLWIRGYRFFEIDDPALAKVGSE